MATAKSLAAAHLRTRQFARRSDRIFADDPRYCLEFVTEGFQDRLDEDVGPHLDFEIIERILAAYAKAAEMEAGTDPKYRPTAWWDSLRRNSLAPVLAALSSRNVDSLRNMYRNFYRDACSTGLIHVPYGRKTEYFGARIRDLHRRYYLGDVLHRLESWKAATKNRFSVSALAGPRIGNPFGVIVDWTVIASRAEYAHACAQTVCEHTYREDASVMEIGGGFGAMAYYLLRDHARIRYVNFDVPESLALAAYYLMRAHPNKRFQLYGEPQPAGGADVVLAPLWTMDDLPPESIDVAFSSHTMSDIAPNSLDGYLRTISRVTHGAFLFVGHAQGHERVAAWVNQHSGSMRRLALQPSPWNRHLRLKAEEVEAVYRVGDSFVPGTGIYSPAKAMGQ